MKKTGKKAKSKQASIAKSSRAKSQGISSSKAFILLSLIAFSMFFTPHLARFFKHSSIMMGEEPYYHARIANQIIEEGMPYEDNFVYGGRHYTLNLYHPILALISSFLGVDFASKMLPFACGMASIALLYFILKKAGFGMLGRISISTAFILSPVSIYIFTFSTPFCIIALLDLLGFYLLMHDDIKADAAAVAVFSAASLFSFTNMIMALLAAASYTIFNSKKKNTLKAMAFLAAMITIFHYTGIYFKFGINYQLKLFEASLLQSFVSDLGGMAGFSIFALVLSLFGLAFAWNSKKSMHPAYLIMAAAIIFSFFYNPAAPYSNFAVSAFAGTAFASLIKMKWKLKLVRNLSIILLFCGLLFSAVSYSVRIAGQLPNEDMIEALSWIRDNSNEGDAVFSHYSNGFWIQLEAGRPVVLDRLAENSAGFKKTADDSSEIFQSWDIISTRNLLTKYNVTFVLVTNNMREGLVWNKPEQGLDYLLRNSETFKKEHSNPYAGVWRYIYR